MLCFFLSAGCFTSSLFCVKREEKSEIVLTVGDPGVTEREAELALSSTCYSFQTKILQEG